MQNPARRQSAKPAMQSPPVRQQSASGREGLGNIVESWRRNDMFQSAACLACHTFYDADGGMQKGSVTSKVKKLGRRTEHCPTGLRKENWTLPHWPALASGTGRPIKAIRAARNSNPRRQYWWDACTRALPGWLRTRSYPLVATASRLGSASRK
eukprot:gene4627-biopygen7179